VVAPFAINCWLTFGDPLYSINVHADVYRAAEGQKIETSQAAAQYLGSLVQRQPVRTLDTFVFGMTEYPFLNKWKGFAQWMPGLGGVLSWSALVGLIVMIGSPPGRLLLVVLAGALVPYALTWKVAADWRFTEHAYPFFLVAACLAISHAVALAAAPSRVLNALRTRPGWKPVALCGAVLVSVAVSWWLVQRAFPFLIVGEALASNQAVTIAAGDRDGAFFAAGWSRPMTGGAVTKRVSEGPRSIVRVPLSRSSALDLTIRLDPFPRPTDETADRLPTVRVFVNDHLAATLVMNWNPERVGAYGIHIPQGMTTAGVNRLVVVAEANAGGPGQVSFWNVRIRPVAQ
jgi:hypothetical protein